MKNLFDFGLAIIVVAHIAIAVWAASATTIGKDCEKLGVFSLGAKVYTCELKKETP